MTVCLILAAGEGSRLRPITNNRPKTLVPLFGKPLLVHQLEVLHAVGIDTISIITGYRAEAIEILGYPTFYNAQYSSTNMVASLFIARDYLNQLDDDLLIAYGDIVYQLGNLETVLIADGDCVVMVDDGWLDLWSARNENPLDDAETLTLDGSGRIWELCKKPTSLDEVQGQYTGLIKIPKTQVKQLVRLYDELDRKTMYDGQPFTNMYMTSLIQRLIEAEWRVQAARVSHGWLEVDTVEDLRIYEQLAALGQLNVLWTPHAS